MVNAAMPSMQCRALERHLGTESAKVQECLQDFVSYHCVPEVAAGVMANIAFQAKALARMHTRFLMLTKKATERFSSLNSEKFVAMEKLIEDRVKSLLLRRSNSFWMYMKPVLKFVADILHGNKAFDSAAQKAIVEQREMKEMADICGDTSRLGLPMSENTSLKEEPQQAMCDLNSIKDALVELINHGEWDNTDKHGLDVFDERCFAMWRALATVRDPMPLHGLLDDIPPMVSPIEEYIRTEAVKFLERFAEGEAWYIKSLTGSFKIKSTSSASLMAPFVFPASKGNRQDLDVVSRRLQKTSDYLGGQPLGCLPEGIVSAVGLGCVMIYVQINNIRIARADGCRKPHT